MLCRTMKYGLSNSSFFLQPLLTKNGEIEKGSTAAGGSYIQLSVQIQLIQFASKMLAKKGSNAFNRFFTSSPTIEIDVDFHFLCSRYLYLTSYNPFLSLIKLGHTVPAFLNPLRSMSSNLKANFTRNSNKAEQYVGPIRK